MKESSDQKTQTVVIRYRNAEEDDDWKTTRNAPSVIVIHRIDELNIMEELGNAALLGREIVNVARNALLHR